MKKILFLASKGGVNSHLTLITRDLNSYKKGGFIIKSNVYSNLEYAIVGQKATIISRKNNMNIKDYDLVVPTTWQRTPEQATACALYLKKNKTKMIFSEFVNFRSHSKLTEYFKLWEKGLPIPNTIYGKNINLVKMLKREHLKFPLIMKDAFHHKGAHNFLVQDIDEFRSVLQKSKGKRFIVQEFIPNKFDYRIIVFGYEPQFVFKRQRSRDANTHLNNTSQGAKAMKFPLSKLNPEIIEETKRACKVMKRNIAGADILIDSKTKKHYFLEINYAPQLRTGSFAEEKMKLYFNFLKKNLQN